MTLVIQIGWLLSMLIAGATLAVATFAMLALCGVIIDKLERLGRR